MKSTKLNVFISITAFFLICLPAILSGQDPKFGPFIVANSINTYDENGKLFSMTGSSDTLVIIAIEGDDDYKYNIQTYVNGEFVYLKSLEPSLRGLSQSERKDFVKYQKSKKYDRDERIKYAKDYDEYKKNKSIDLTLIKTDILYYGNQIDIFDSQGRNIGTRKITYTSEPYVVYSSFYKNINNSDYSDTFYKIIFQGENIIVNSKLIERGRYPSYIGENRRYALAQEIYKKEMIKVEAVRAEKQANKNAENANIAAKNKSEADVKAWADQFMKERTMVASTKATSIVGDRQDAPQAKIMPQSIGSLTAATGWGKLSNQKWFSMKNFIRYGSPSDPIDIGFESLGLDNFKSFNLHKMTYGGKDYLILIKSFKDGYYKYREIMRGWTTLTSHEYFVFESKHLDMFKDIKERSMDTISVPALIFDKAVLFNFSLKGLEDEITSKIAHYNKYGQSSYHDLRVYISLPSGKNVVRFIISQAEFSEVSLKGGDTQPFSTGFSKMEEGYYETSLENFSKLFPLR